MRRLLASALLVASVAGSTTARADEPEDEPDSLVWKDGWRRFHWGEYVATGAAFAGIAVGLFAVPQQVGNWRGGILFDDWFRDRLALGSYD
ncbi:MAG: hypothetical protein KC731_17380, partial [Myxococcales bacterium]|nr:hypothetical protein [Myxococcales bacterium]